LPLVLAICLIASLSNSERFNSKLRAVSQSAGLTVTLTGIILTGAFGLPLLRCVFMEHYLQAPIRKDGRGGEQNDVAGMDGF